MRVMLVDRGDKQLNKRYNKQFNKRYNKQFVF